jgi:hypothetical protein
MAYLSEWLQIMLGEIARKQEEVQRAAEEDEQRRRDAQVKPDHSGSCPESINTNLSGAHS